MPGTEDESESDEEKAAATPTPTSTAWPKRPGERIAAIRDLVLGSKRVWRTEDVASNFKGAKKKDVEDFLDSLAGIGVLVAYGEAGKDLRWGPPVMRQVLGCGHLYSHQSANFKVHAQVRVDMCPRGSPSYRVSNYSHLKR